MSRTYLDYNATAPLRGEARAAMIAAMDVVGNPSSVHAEGRRAKGLIEEGRATLAEALGARPDEVIFTSGATEAAALALGPQVARHASIEVDFTAHDALFAHHAPREDATARVVAQGWANSETGIITEPEAPAAGTALVLDATQGIGRLPFAFSWSPAQAVILSAHKFGGPKGAGALLLREGIEIDAVLRGGGQEMGRRAGTENILGVVGMAAAAKAAMDDLAAGRWSRVAELRNILEKAIAAESADTIFLGQDAQRLPNTSCFVTPGWKGETQVMAMDLAGFAVSAGSACSSGKVKTSRVLRAHGLGDDLAACALRVSLGLETTEDEVLRFAEAWTKKRARLRAA